MFYRRRRLLIAAAAAGACLLATPAAAVADNGGGSKCSASACKVYHEPSVTANGNQGGGPATSGPATPPPKPLRVSKKAKSAISHAGKQDKKVLHSMITNPAYGRQRDLQIHNSGPVAQPTAVTAAVDLGSGPTTLLAIVAGTMVLLLAGTGFRGWRRWRTGRTSPRS
jgi:hypothetical protein